jgi:hypothetical protein
MAEASIKNQAALIWLEADLVRAYYKQSRYGKAVLVPVPRRVGLGL